MVKRTYDIEFIDTKIQVKTRALVPAPATFSKHRSDEPYMVHFVALLRDKKHASTLDQQTIVRLALLALEFNMHLDEYLTTALATRNVELLDASNDFYKPE